MPETRVHAFGDDALGDDDAVALAARVRAGEVSPQELAAAAAERAGKVDARLRAITYPMFGKPRYGTDAGAALFGVPTYVKDNTDIAGVPTNHGSEAFTAKPAKKDGAYTTQYLSTGLTVIGKSRLPEFGFNATTEFMTEEPARNPWHTDHSVGASSGGAAALVASGVVPIAHANDGGGSIRIPAACAGLVGLKPSRGRHVDGEQASHLPINMISEGVVTRTDRDTATFLAACEDHWRSPAMPPIGLVDGPAQRRLRIGLVVDSVTGPADEPTRLAVEQTAAALEKAGHHVEPMALPVDDQFVDDFLQYWALLAELVTDTARLMLDRSFDTKRIDGLTRGLRAHHRKNLRRTPGAIRRLRRIPAHSATIFARRELVLSPVLAHTTPLLGYIAPTVPFDELVTRLRRYVAYTPLNNIAGTPAISLPLSMSEDGLPIGVQLIGPPAGDALLFRLSAQLEEARPWADRRPPIS